MKRTDTHVLPLARVSSFSTLYIIALFQLRYWPLEIGGMNTKKLKYSMVKITSGPESKTIHLIWDQYNLNIRFVIVIEPC